MPHFVSDCSDEVLQSASLSQAITSRFKAMYPEVPVISINVFEFEKATYSNRNLI